MKVSEFPSPKIEVVCPCGRRGVYSKERFDQDLQLPDLLVMVTKDCPKAGALEMLDRCRAVYPQLAIKQALDA